MTTNRTDQKKRPAFYLSKSLVTGGMSIYSVRPVGVQRILCFNLLQPEARPGFESGSNGLFESISQEAMTSGQIVWSDG